MEPRPFTARPQTPERKDTSKIHRIDNTGYFGPHGSDIEVVVSDSDIPVQANYG